MIAKPFPRLWDFSETLVRAIPHREKISNSVKPSKEWRACQNYPKTTSTTHLGLPKKSRTTSKESQASLASVKVHDSTIIKQMALKNKTTVLEWLSQSPGWDAFWYNLKQVVHPWKPSNNAGLIKTILRKRVGQNGYVKRCISSYSCLTVVLAGSLLFPSRRTLFSQRAR